MPLARLGSKPDPLAGYLDLVILPDFLDEVGIRNFSIGGSSVHVRLHRYGRDVTANVLSREGSIRVALFK
jgi:hypothetical protein